MATDATPFDRRARVIDEPQLLDVLLVLARGGHDENLGAALVFVAELLPEESGQVLAKLLGLLDVLRHRNRQRLDAIGLAVLLVLGEQLLEALIVGRAVVLIEVEHLLDPPVIDGVTDAVAKHDVGEVVVARVARPAHADVVTEAVISVRQELVPALEVLPHRRVDVMGLIGQHKRVRAHAGEAVADA